jgi:hypothetical protein
MTTTQSDVVGAAGGQAGSTTVTKDVYGRAIKVDELVTGTTKATTTYSYDPADNVVSAARTPCSTRRSEMRPSERDADDLSA